MRQTANIIGYILVIVVNGLANILPINGQTTAEISDSLPTLLTPAGFTFSIWGLIYLALGAFVVYQALPAQRNDSDLGRVGYWFVLSCIANTAWILAWHYELFLLSVLIMLGLLVCLLAIYRRLDIGQTQVSNAKKWLVHGPFSLYLGWISVATIVNISALLVHLDWNGFGISDPGWMFMMLVVITLLTITMIITRNDAIFAGVVMWALFGVIVEQGEATNMTNTIAIAIALIGATVLIRMVANWRTESGIVSITNQNRSTQ